MLVLTNAHPDKSLNGQLILIAAKHIVSLRPVVNATGIRTVDGFDYRVAETIDEIGKMSAWNLFN